MQQVRINSTQKKIFVYDTSKGYSRLIKQHYGNIFEVTQCKDSKKIINADIGCNDIAVVIINHQEDIIKLLLVHSNIKNVFLGSRIKNFDHSLYKLKGIIYLDLFEKKKDLLNYINIKLEQLNLLN